MFSIKSILLVLIRFITCHGEGMGKIAFSNLIIVDKVSRFSMSLDCFSVSLREDLHPLNKTKDNISTKNIGRPFVMGSLRILILRM